MDKKALNLILVLAGFGFASNLIWENLQAPLYGYSYVKFWQHFGMCFWATIGDVVFIVVLYGIMAWLRKNWFWILEIKIQDIVILLLLGGLGAVVIEKVALGLFAWRYTSAMPVIPWLKVGLIPVLQMLILPLWSFYLTRFILNKQYVTR